MEVAASERNGLFHLAGTAGLILGANMQANHLLVTLIATFPLTSIVARLCATIRLSSEIFSIGSFSRGWTVPSVPMRGFPSTRLSPLVCRGWFRNHVQLIDEIMFALMDDQDRA